MNRLDWVTKFIEKNSYAPFLCENDKDYYDTLKAKYKVFYESALKAGADQESLSIIKKYDEEITRSIRAYYEGHISQSHKIIKKLVNDCSNNKLALSSINFSYGFPGKSGSELQLFRARLSNEIITYKSKDMLHLPYALRGKTGNYRFSIPGLPSLYLGNSSYACWIELGRPADYKFNVSPVLLDGTQKVFNLAVKTRELLYLNDLEVERVHCWLKLLMLMFATSFKINEQGRIFKSEYIVSQSIMLACRELGYDGVVYLSKRVCDEVFSVSATNLALFAPYSKKNNYSDICKHIKICDSFNFAMYKQLKGRSKFQHYRLRLEQTGRINNIGGYDRQFPYTETEFYDFDQFLFSTWNKDNISWGNAVK